MAKKNSKNTKRKSTASKTSRNKKQSSKGGLVVSLIGIIAILGVVFSYYFKMDPPDSVGSKQTRPIEEQTSSNSNNDNRNEERGTSSDEIQHPDEESIETNPAIPEVSEVEQYYFTYSFDFGWPSYDVDDLIVEHTGFTLSYDERNEQPFWVAYELKSSNLNNARFKRKDNFRADPLVRTESALPSDYKGSGYDRGHLAPAADFTWSEEALDHTFYMSNMSPQVPGFNRGIWKKLEEQVREWALENGSIFVVTGPIVEDRKERIGKNKVTVPQYYYKAILDIQKPDIKAIGFVLKNEKSDKELFSFAVSIDKLEEMTDLDFFPLLPDDMERNLESTLNVSGWK